MDNTTAVARSGTRTRNLYNPDATSAFAISRSKIEAFVRCARCFYLDRRAGVGVPERHRMGLQTAVDLLLKREFDAYRQRGEPHPITVWEGIAARPLAHPSLDEWRDAMRGIRVVHALTGFVVYGAVDDVWVDEKGRMIVVDYKSTSTEHTPSLKGGPWSAGYKRQLEVYQWLLRKSGFPVADTAYVLFANADRTRDAFDARLEFSYTLVPHNGSDAWVEDALKEMHLCLQRDVPPAAHPQCEWCAYRKAARDSETL